MVKLGKEQPFERGVSGSRSYLDHEATTSIGGGSSQECCSLIHDNGSVLHSFFYS